MSVHEPWSPLPGLGPSVETSLFDQPPRLGLRPLPPESKQGGQLLLDPSLEESGGEEGSMVVALMPELNEVTALQVRGLWADSELREGLELALGGCGQLKAVMREALLAAIEEPATAA
jgi:hypothetical protein